MYGLTDEDVELISTQRIMGRTYFRKDALLAARLRKVMERGERVKAEADLHGIPPPHRKLFLRLLNAWRLLNLSPKRDASALLRALMCVYLTDAGVFPEAQVYADSFGLFYDAADAGMDSIIRGCQQPDLWPWLYARVRDPCWTLAPGEYTRWFSPDFRARVRAVILCLHRALPLDACTCASLAQRVATHMMVGVTDH
jgi:hypothetical protein